MKSENQEFDDLKRLGNIGDTSQTFLRQELNIRTYEDFANHSVNEIEAVFKAKGKPYSRKVIQQWIERAQQEVNLMEKTENWEWLEKIFVVEFRVSTEGSEINNLQSRIYHIKVDKNGEWLENGEKTPIPKSGNELYPWMLEQLGENLQEWGVEDNETKEKPIAEAQDTTAVDPLPTINRLEIIEINEIRIFHVSDLENPIGVGRKESPLEDTIQDKAPLALEVSFNLPELAEANIKPDTTYRVELYIRHKEGSVSIGETQPKPLINGKVAYTAQLTDVTLPSGEYDLGSIVYIQSQPPSANFLKIQVLSNNNDLE